jgi:hypothetical protein
MELVLHLNIDSSALALESVVRRVVLAGHNWQQRAVTRLKSPYGLAELCRFETLMNRKSTIYMFVILRCSI